VVRSATIPASSEGQIFNIASDRLVESARRGSIEDILIGGGFRPLCGEKQGGLHFPVYSALEEANARHSVEIHWLQRLQQGALGTTSSTLLPAIIMPGRRRAAVTHSGGSCGLAGARNASRFTAADFILSA